jgi:hypothetical protein
MSLQAFRPKMVANVQVKSLTLALLQTVTTFLPDDVIRKNNRLSVDKDGIPNADEALGIASTTRRKVAEETIEADDTDWGNGQVTGKQWWTGVQPGEMGGWDLNLLIPVSGDPMREVCVADVAEWHDHHSSLAPRRSDVHAPPHRQRQHLCRCAGRAHQLFVN